MHTTPRPVARHEVLAATLTALLFGMSCHDDPVRIAGPSSPTSTTPPPAVAASYQPLGDAIVVPLGDSAFATVTVPLPYFAKTTLVRVTASGSLTTRLTPYNNGAPGTPPSPGAPRTFGPGGYYWGSPSYWGCGNAIRVAYNGGEVFQPSCASDGSTDTLANRSGHIYVQGLGSAIRTAPAPATGGSNDCSYYDGGSFSGWGPCFYYSTSGQSVAIERVVATLDLVATPDTPDYQDSVSFIATVSPGSAEGRDVPWTVDSVQWVAADGSYSGWSQPCAWNHFQPVNSGSTRTCRNVVTRSGTLTLFATVNGETQSSAATITVRRPKLIVTPEQTTVLVGENLTHTATVVPPTKANGQPSSWQVTGWRFQQGIAPYWTGPACGTLTSCTLGPYLMLHDGSTLIVYATINGTPDSAQAVINVRPTLLSVSATPDFIDAGDTVSFAATINPSSGHTMQVTGWRWDSSPDAGGISSECTASENPCARAITKSGVMTVFATLDGQYADSAVAAVVVFGLHDGAGCLAATSRSPVSPVSGGAIPRGARLPSRPAFDCEAPPPLPGGKINLVCQSKLGDSLLTTGQVRRGEIISCVAGGPTATDRVTVSSWKWRYASGLNVAGVEIERSDTQKASPVWAGTIVADGRVIVTGAINGTAAQPDTVFVVALPRPGWDTLPPRDATPTIQTEAAVTGLAVRPWRGQLGRTPNPTFELPPGTLRRVSSGPNATMMYTDSMYFVRYRVSVNLPAMRDSSEFWLAHDVAPTDGSCARSYISGGLVTEVMRHEGSQFDTLSHTRVFRDSLRAQNTGTVVEAIAGLSIDVNVFDRLLGPHKRRARLASRHTREPFWPWEDSGGLVPLPELSCELRYF